MVSGTMRVTVYGTLLVTVYGTFLTQVYGTCSQTVRLTIVVQGTCSQTVRTCHTWRVRVSSGQVVRQISHLPFFTWFWHVQGSKQHSSGVRCQEILVRPGTQYVSVLHSLTLRLTVLQVVTGSQTVFWQVL